jgi:polyhydroxybutyrate depolymerase
MDIPLIKGCGMDHPSWKAIITIVLVVALFSITPPYARTPVQGATEQNYSGSLLHAGLKRTYLLHVPASYMPANPTALVIALHGGGGDGQKMQALSGLNIVSNRKGFIVVYPDAVEKNWNDGRNLKRYRSQRENIDDVGFISKLMDELANHYTIDHKRVYVTGASNGAMMSYRLACELTDKITAVAPVIGALGENTAGTCSPSRPLPVLLIGGTDDPLMPWEGGYVHFFRKKFGKTLSFPETANFWVLNNGCSPSPTITDLPDSDPNDGTRVRKTVYDQCQEGVEVVLLEIRGGGHTWPGGLQYLPKFFIGKTSRDINGTEVIWDFFKKYRR